MLALFPPPCGTFQQRAEKSFQALEDRLRVGDYFRKGGKPGTSTATNGCRCVQFAAGGLERTQGFFIALCIYNSGVSFLSGAAAQELGNQIRAGFLITRHEPDIHEKKRNPFCKLGGVPT